MGSFCAAAVDGLGRFMVAFAVLRFDDAFPRFDGIKAVWRGLDDVQLWL
jgi:hypothetical protein